MTKTYFIKIQSFSSKNFQNHYKDFVGINSFTYLCTSIGSLEHSVQSD